MRSLVIEYVYLGRFFINAMMSFISIIIFLQYMYFNFRIIILSYTMIYSKTLKCIQEKAFFCFFICSVFFCLSILFLLFNNFFFLILFSCETTKCLALSSCFYLCFLCRSPQPRVSLFVCLHIRLLPFGRSPFMHDSSFT